MQTYELTIVLVGGVTAVKKKSTQELIKKLVKINKGKVGKVEDWGRIALEYDIKGNESGNFLYFPLELSPETVKTIGEKLKFEEDIVRYLLVRKDPPSHKATAGRGSKNGKELKQGRTDW